jgi:glycosyltransferase involved in cell wall biosynthesis
MPQNSLIFSGRAWAPFGLCGGHTRAAAEVGICWCPASHPEPPEDTLQGLEQAGVMLYRIPPPFLSPRYAVRLARVIRQARPDVLHLHGGTIGCIGSVVGRICRVPGIIYTEHLPCHPIDTEQADWCHARWIRVSRYATATALHDTAAISENVAATLPATTRTWEVIHNGVDLSGYRQAVDHGHRNRKRSGLAVGPDQKLIVGVGSLTARKSYATAIQAIAKCKSGTGDGLVLAVCGEGPDRAQLEAMAADMGLAENMRLLGWRDDVPDILRAADLFVHPARDEGFGLVVVEAAAAGLPIVASQVGGIPEIITHEHDGLLVPPGEPNALAAAVQRLLNDPEQARRLGENARRTAIERFSAEAMAERYMKLYERLLRDVR